MTNTKKDIEKMAQMAIWEAIHRANKSGFFKRELEEFIEIGENKKPTAKQKKWFSDEVNRWLKKFDI